MRAADTLIAAIARHGVDTVFGIPGGAALPLYEALAARPEIRHVLTRHEAAAGHAAEGWARTTGRPGVAFATSGPGAVNLLTAVADATGGQYVRAQDAQQLTDVLTGLPSSLVVVHEEREITSWFVAGAVALLLVGLGLAAWWGRARVSRSTPPRRRTAPAPPRAASAPAAGRRPGSA